MNLFRRLFTTRELPQPDGRVFLERAQSQQTSAAEMAVPDAREGELLFGNVEEWKTGHTFLESQVVGDPCTKPFDAVALHLEFRGNLACSQSR
jgi:hypothetical protein